MYACGVYVHVLLSVCICLFECMVLATASDPYLVVAVPFHETHNAVEIYIFCKGCCQSKFVEESNNIWYLGDGPPIILSDNE